MIATLAEPETRMPFLNQIATVPALASRHGIGVVDGPVGAWRTDRSWKHGVPGVQFWCCETAGIAAANAAGAAGSMGAIAQ
jgi:hypothetical protein